MDHGNDTKDLQFKKTMKQTLILDLYVYIILFYNANSILFYMKVCASVLNNVDNW